MQVLTPWDHTAVIPPRKERTLVRKAQMKPRTTAKDLVKMLEEKGTKVSISTVKRVLYSNQIKVYLSSALALQ